MPPRLLIGLLGLEQASLGLGIQRPSPEVVEKTANPCIGDGTIRASHVDGERLQPRPIGDVHLDIHAGQSDVDPLGIRQVCFGRKREDSCQHFGMPERERFRPPIIRDPIDTGNTNG